MSDLGFTAVDSAPEVVRFESPDAFLELGHAPYDREVYARVGRLGAPGITEEHGSESLDVLLYLAVKDPEAHLSLYRDVPYACADADSQVERVLSHFASGLASHGRGLLVPDESVYAYARGLRFWHAPETPPDSEGAATREA